MKHHFSIWLVLGLVLIPGVRAKNQGEKSSERNPINYLETLLKTPPDPPRKKSDLDPEVKDLAILVQTVQRIENVRTENNKQAWRLLSTGLGVFLYNRNTGAVYKYWREKGKGHGFDQVPMESVIPSQIWPLP